MSENEPLYSSRITKIYLEYIGKRYPQVDVDSILEAAGMSKYEVEDPAHWFTQEQVDLFQKVLVEKTGNVSISREAGRYAASTESLGPAKQYTLGLVGLASVYMFMGKAYTIMSRGARITSKKLGPNKIEIISTPNQNVNEKPYQCENRIGTFEAIAKWFTHDYATIDHPECLHRGAQHCRYIITWKDNPYVKWKIVRNYLLPVGLAALIVLLFALPIHTWVIAALSMGIVLAAISYNSERLEKLGMMRTIEAQGNVAKQHLKEINKRYNNALLVQEIGQITSTILDTEKLVQYVIQIMEKRLDFDRCMIMLTNESKTKLVFKGGYGYAKEKEESYLKTLELNLDNPESKGTLVLALRERRPILLNDITDIKEKFSFRSQELAEKMDVKSLICVPIIYENEGLGILTVDNHNTKRQLTQSDVSLLMGIVSQTAVSIVNARSFKKIRESESKYRELVENANSIIMRMDVEGRITFFNEFAQRFFGYTEHEMLGRLAEGVIFPKPKPGIRGLIRLIDSFRADPDRHLVNERQAKLKNGTEAWIAWTYKPIFDDEGSFRQVLCIGNDITELKRSSEEKKKLEAKLQQAKKMEAIGTLAGGVAHDLNNILAGLVSYPELLLMQLPEDSPLRKPLTTMKKSGEKASTIVRDLLTLARRGVANMEVANFNRIIREYLTSPEYEKLQVYHPTVTVKTELNPDLRNIIGSPVHLSKTIMNLVANAAEAMPDGGTIRVYSDNMRIDKKSGVVGLQETGDYVVVKISDSGVGIEEDDLERIFEPFYTKKVMGRSGTGLGMAVVWGTVQDHNGLIDVDSIVGVGTTFTLYFPATSRRMEASTSAISLEDLHGKGEKILIIDDVEEQREVASEMLKNIGYLTATVSSGNEAVEFMKINSADLLILDMIMEPGMDGLETYRKILELHPKQKAIITSGYSETERVKEAQKLGAGAYVRKPYHLEILAYAIRNELIKP